MRSRTPTCSDDSVRDRHGALLTDISDRRDPRSRMWRMPSAAVRSRPSWPRVIWHLRLELRLAPWPPFSGHLGTTRPMETARAALPRLPAEPLVRGVSSAFGASRPPPARRHELRRHARGEEPGGRARTPGTGHHGELPSSVSSIAFSRFRSFLVARLMARSITGVATLENPAGVPRLRSDIRVAPRVVGSQV